MRCLRPDRISIALEGFIRKILPNGNAFVEMDATNSFIQKLENTYDNVESNPAIPIFFILSPGADPTSEVIKYGESKGFMA